MKLWTAAEVCAAVGSPSTPADNWIATGVSIDSRTVVPGDLFVALVGPTHDGHAHVASALAAGAAGAVVHGPVEGRDGDGRLITTQDTFIALQDLGRSARDRFTGKVIGVTGSVGKTSTKEMLARALNAIAPAHAAVGSLNNHWGVPLTLARMPREAAFAVIEMGMNHAGEIAALSALARPTIAVITAIAPAHIEHFGTLEAIADAKAEIFGSVTAGGTAVLPRDSHQYAQLATAAKAAGLTIVSFGEHPAADYCLVAASIEGDRTDVVARLPDGRGLSYVIGAAGHHWALDSLAVLAVAAACGEDPERAAVALAAMTPPKGRGQRHRVALPDGGSILVIDDAYNANPESVKAGLAVLAAAVPGPGGRRIAALGDMLELGTLGPSLHAGLAEDVLARRLDLVYTAGPLARHLADALPPAHRGQHAETSRDLAPLLTADIRAGDVVLVKGSAGSSMGRVVEALLALAPSS